MAYIGNSPVIGDFRKLDDLTSSFDNVTQAFNITSSSVPVVPGTPNILLISLNGALQEPGVDFTVESSVITFATPPETGTNFVGIVMGNTGTVNIINTIDAADLTIVGNLTIESNLTVQDNFILDGHAVQTAVTLTGAVVDCSQSNYFIKTVEENTPFSFTNVPAGVYGFILKIINGGSQVTTFPGNVKWPSGLAPSLTSSGTDIIGFITDDGGTIWRGSVTMLDSR